MSVATKYQIKIVVTALDGDFEGSHLNTVLDDCPREALLSDENKGIAAAVRCFEHFTTGDPAMQELSEES